MPTKLNQLADLGQSVWLDYINRDIIESGKLKAWIEEGLRGMTSNPSIFNQVISQGGDYDGAIRRLKEEGKSTFEIYDALTIRDIQDAADLFRPVYEKTEGLDGYVSLEINPQMADDTQASIDEGRRLFKEVARPNVMIKVPATEAGFPVVEELLASGINVNVTLIFSVDQYCRTVRSYCEGLTRLSRTTPDLRQVRSVASVFVSRVDSVVDKLIDEKVSAKPQDALKAELLALKGTAAVANCRVILECYQELFARAPFKALAAQNAQIQRVLWGSTSTKNPLYNDVKYVEELITPLSVNTIPEKTLKAFLDHGEVKTALTDPAESAEAVLKALDRFGIKVNDVCQDLLDDGVAAFQKAFEELLQSIEAKAQQLCESTQ